MENNIQTPVDPQQLKEAEDAFGKFIHASKWAIIAIGVLLMLMALLLV